VIADFSLLRYADKYLLTAESFIFSYKYFVPYEADVKRMLQFQPEVIEKAAKIASQLFSRYGN
jgi:hypothetical protein